MPHDRTSSSLRLVQHLGYFINRAHVVSQLDPGGTVATQSSPQAKDRPARLKEAHLVIGLLCTRPAKGFVEASSSDEIGDAESDQTDALFHSPIMANVWQRDSAGGCESEPNLAVPDGGGRYRSVTVVNQDHHANRLLHGARTYVVSQAEFDTQYVAIAARILVDPLDS